MVVFDRCLFLTLCCKYVVQSLWTTQAANFLCWAFGLGLTSKFLCLSLSLGLMQRASCPPSDTFRWRRLRKEDSQWSVLSRPYNLTFACTRPEKMHKNTGLVSRGLWGTWPATFANRHIRELELYTVARALITSNRFSCVTAVNDNNSCGRPDQESFQCVPPSTSMGNKHTCHILGRNASHRCISATTVCLIHRVLLMASTDSSLMVQETTYPATAEPLVWH